MQHFGDIPRMRPRRGMAIAERMIPGSCYASSITGSPTPIAPGVTTDP